MDLQEILDGLAAPFSADVISWRVGPTNDKSRQQDQQLRGQPLAYIDARDVMDRLDMIVGFECWQCNYTAGVGNSIVCNIGVRIAGEWVWKGDGAGPSDTEPEKGALSDAFKRAGVRWGIGRYLYDIKAPWINLEKRGNTAFIPENAYPGLATLHDNVAKLVRWGDAAGGAAYKLLLSHLEKLNDVSRADFTTVHAEQIGKLPRAMRNHLLAKLEKAAA